MARGSAGPDEPSRPSRSATTAIDLQPITLTEDDTRGYYNGFANATLWPLYHDAIRPSKFEAARWQHLRRPSTSASPTRRAAVADAAIVWIHDYHLQLVPQMLRELAPDVRIGFFLHIPFPPQELFMRLPWRTEITAGLLGADVVGFQSRRQRRRTSSGRLPPAGVRPCERRAAVDERNVLVSTFPISHRCPAARGVAASRARSQRVRAIRAALGDPEIVLLGVDRIDYTKGITSACVAYRVLFEEGTIDPSDTVHGPDRAAEPRGGRALRRHRATSRAPRRRDQRRTADIGHPAVNYLHQSLPLDELVALYLAGTSCS